MPGYAVVEARVREELLREARRLGIDPSRVLEEALEDEIRRRRLQELEEKLRKRKELLEKIDVESLVRLVREDREAR